jgi:6-pyruvoyl-tetrahydropterin synthase
MSNAEFEVFLNSADFKFYCAHFIIHKGFREKLHGHNYQVSIRLTGSDQLGSDGYLIDFGEVKKLMRSICREINEYFICPMKSQHMKVATDNDQLCLECEDGAKFSFPLTDCALLPLYHSSAEEITHYLWCTIVK